MRGLLGAKAPLARQLADLRKACRRAGPGDIKLGGRAFALRDEMEELDRYFERFAHCSPAWRRSWATHRGPVLPGAGQRRHPHGTGSLATEMETLRQYAFLAGAWTTSWRPDRCDGGTDAPAPTRCGPDVLAVVRRRQEILTQLAIVTAGLRALRIVEDNNAEVIRAVASAITTTTAALRTAVMVAQAAASQRIALEQLEAAQAGRQRDGRASGRPGGRRRAGPGGRVAMLRERLERGLRRARSRRCQKAQVLRTISEADRELTRPKPGAWLPEPRASAIAGPNPIYCASRG
jgi:hypothetical protein